LFAVGSRLFFLSLQEIFLLADGMEVMGFLEVGSVGIAGSAWTA
jgi:hypothetical protein